MMNTIKCFYNIRRFYTSKSFDKLLGLDFPSSRMVAKKNPNKVIIKINNMKMYDPHNKSIKNNNIDYDKTLGVDFPSSRFK